MTPSENEREKEEKKDVNHVKANYSEIPSKHMSLGRGNPSLSMSGVWSRLLCRRLAAAGRRSSGSAAG